MHITVYPLYYNNFLSFSGVYLASVIYHEDRVAMTTEDFLPVLEVDESYPSSIHADFHWLMKVRNNTCRRGVTLHIRVGSRSPQSDDQVTLSCGL